MVTFAFVSIASLIAILDGQAFAIFIFLIATSLGGFFAIGKSPTKRLAALLRYGGLATLGGAIIVGAFWVLMGWLWYGDPLSSIITAPLLLTFALLPAAVIALPIMHFRRYLGEPYYFLLFLIIGFFGGIFIMMLVLDRNLFDASGYLGWQLCGTLGTIFAVTSWALLRRTEQLWLQAT